MSQGVSGVPAIPPDLLSRSARTQEGYSAKAQKSLPMSGINRRWLKPPLQWKKPTAPHLGSSLQKDHGPPGLQSPFPSRVQYVWS